MAIESLGRESGRMIWRGARGVMRNQEFPVYPRAPMPLSSQRLTLFGFQYERRIQDCYTRPDDG